MAETYFKAVRPDGGSFRDPSFKWATEPGGITTHPNPYASHGGGDAARYLSVSTAEADCTGFEWPARLLLVEPVGAWRVWAPHPDSLPNKRAAGAFRTVEELPAWRLFGPQGEHMVALIVRAGVLTADEARELYAARDAARDAGRYAGWDAAWYAARDAARDAGWYAGRYAGWDAAGYAGRYAGWDAAGYAARDAGRYAGLGLVVRDLIDTTAYDTLTRPWRTAVGRIHPDDPDLR